MDLNKIELIGRLTADPDARDGVIDAPRTYVRLATGRAWKDAQGKLHHETGFHAVVMFGRLGEIAKQYLKKGDRIYVEGRLQRSDYNTPSGYLQSRIEVVGINLIMLGGRPEARPKGGNDEVIVEEVDDGKGEV
jgi:single-strand DNA-binding protein